MDVGRMRHYSARRRVNVCASLGVIAGAAAAFFLPWQLATLVGWTTMTGALLAWIWTDIGQCDAAETQARSTLEDNSRVEAVVVMVSASVVSLVGVGFGLAKARHVSTRMEVALTLVSVAAVVLSWCVVHTMFTVHYAHQYYRDPVGGIEFPGSEAPDYRDFAYYAFTVGASFAVSDTNVTSRVIRRMTLRHSLVSYLFGTVIVGLTINVLASFIQ
jgi:uncharacterized membrane protein